MGGKRLSKPHSPTHSIYQNGRNPTIEHHDKGQYSKGENRVNRGGSWNNNAENCRPANRNDNNPTNRNNNLGFRVAASLFQLKDKAGRISLNRVLSCPTLSGVGENAVIRAEEPTFW